MPVIVRLKSSVMHEWLWHQPVGISQNLCYAQRLLDNRPPLLKVSTFSSVFCELFGLVFKQKHTLVK